MTAPRKSESAAEEREAQIRRCVHAYTDPCDDCEFLLALLDQARKEHLKFIAEHNFGAFQTLKQERDAAIARAEKAEADAAFVRKEWVARVDQVIATEAQVEQLKGALREAKETIAARTAELANPNQMSTWDLALLEILDAALAATAPAKTEEWA